MQYLLFMLLVLLFFVSYYFSGRDFFAPATVQVIGFAFGTLMCAYLMYSTSMSYKLHVETVRLITSCLALSVAIGILVHHIFLRTKVHQLTFAAQEVTPISPKVSAFSIILLLVTIFWMLYEIRRIGGSSGTFNEIMVIFRNRNSYSTDLEARLPFLLRQLLHLTTVLFVMYGFNLLRFFRELSLHEKIIDILIISLSVIAELLDGARGSAVNNILAFIMMFHLLRIQRQGKYKTYSIGQLIRLLLLACVALWGFSALRWFVGRTSQAGALEYIANYAGAEIINFDVYLQEPTFTTGVFGKYTFLVLISNLRNLGMDIVPYTVHLEHHSVDGIGLGNTYTLFRTYYADFGIIGVYVLHCLASLILAIFYEHVKKRRGNEGILVFSLMYYSVVLSFFGEKFYSNIISISYLENVIFTVLFYKLFLQKSLRFVFGGKRFVVSMRDRDMSVRSQ